MARHQAENACNTQHMMFFVVNWTKQQHIKIHYCLTSDMVGVFFMKPLTSAKFWQFHLIMNCNHNELGSVTALNVDTCPESEQNNFYEPTQGKSKTSPCVDSQECVGEVGKRS